MRYPKDARGRGWHWLAPAYQCDEVIRGDGNRLSIGHQFASCGCAAQVGCCQPGLATTLVYFCGKRPLVAKASPAIVRLSQHGIRNCFGRTPAPPAATVPWCSCLCDLGQKRAKRHTRRFLADCKRGISPTNRLNEFVTDRSLYGTKVAK